MSTKTAKALETVTSKSITEVTNFGAGDDINANDIYIGRLQVMQPLSEFVKQDKAKAGQIINSLTQKILAEKEKPLDVIVINSFKYWIEKELTAAGEVFKCRYPAESANEKAWQEGNIKRIFHHSYYVLLPTDLTMPLELTFRSTGVSSAKVLASFIFRLKGLQLPSWATTFTLSTFFKTGKNNKQWWAADIVEGRKTTDEEIKVAVMWNQLLKKANVVVAEEEEENLPVSSDLY